MAVALNKFNAFVADIHNKVHNLGSDTIKILLSNVAPVATNAVKSDITEIGAGNGYSAGGTALSGVTSSQSGGTYNFKASNLTIVTASGSVGPFRYAVLYNATPVAGNLIGWWDYGSSITLANTETFSVTFDGTNGLFSCT
jgi:hypothetical protein